MLLLLLVTLLAKTPDPAPPASGDRWILRELIRDKSFTGEVFSTAHVRVPDLFWPPDLVKESYPRQIYHEHLIKSGGQLFQLIEGTGRVYLIDLAGDSLSWTRVDASRLAAYNYTAYSFENRDTLFSIGGYGLWTFNGHLRYFDRKSGGWEIRTLNRKVNIQNTTIGIFRDVRNDALYFIDRGESDDHIHADISKAEADRNRGNVLRLNLATGNWEVMGKSEPDITWGGRAIKAGNLPFGELIVLGSQQQYQTWVLDYQRNRLLQLTDAERCRQLYEAAVISNTTAERRVISYYRDSTLVIMTSDGGVRKIILREKDFIPSGKALYAAGLPFGWIWIAGIVLVVTPGLLWFFFRRSGTSPSSETQVIFSGKETLLIHAILKNPESKLTPEAVDNILSPEITSRDAINQRRSLTLRSINSRFAELTGSATDLIQKRRLESDRRMIEYWIAPEEKEMLARIIDLENGE